MVLRLEQRELDNVMGELMGRETDGVTGDKFLTFLRPSPVLQITHSTIRSAIPGNTVVLEGKGACEEEFLVSAGAHPYLWLMLSNYQLQLNSKG